jgi:hypothetical protein
MPDEPRRPLPHLLVRGSANPEPYTYPHEGPGTGVFVALTESG